MQRVHWLSGLDEAGYGPALGPLVVGFANLSSGSLLEPAQPWKLLAPTVVHRASKSRGIPVADSKKLYTPQTGLKRLETSVLAFLGLSQGGSSFPRSFRTLLDWMSCNCSYLDSYPWYRGEDIELPVEADPLEVTGALRRLVRAFERSELTLDQYSVRPVEVCEFNQLLGAAASTTKSDVNAQTLGHFLTSIWNSPQWHECQVMTDRLGGRTRYGPFLYSLFQRSRLDIIEQTSVRQSYQIQDERRQLSVRFTVDGESKSFPTALASMAAKYVRELHMKLLNRWWIDKCPELKSTAGYPGDAQRFLADIAAVRRELKIDDGILIRER